MDNNQLLHMLCTALKISNTEAENIFRLSGQKVAAEKLNGLFSDPLTAEFEPCPDALLCNFLDGLIVTERGPRNDARALVVAETALTNNQILKKLRIALDLHAQDMQSIFEEGGAELTASEFGALFRKEGNKHFRLCNDELLLCFLTGLSPSLDA
ncbi:MAG: DUF1456 family protein [Halioglobus sp.]